MKRLFDVIIAGIILIIFSPFFFVLGILVFVFLGKPIFFRQVRPGLSGKPFVIIKFRTMTDKRDSTGKLLPNDKRITRFGTFLRHSSLDEIPEFLNVIKGDMSLVGPRPLLMDYLPLFNEFQKLRHNVKPGITGWAQVNGRNAISWDDKFNFDVWYVKNQSFMLDLRILCMTVIKAFRREGITHHGDVAMPRFTGNKQ